MRRFFLIFGLLVLTAVCAGSETERWCELCGRAINGVYYVFTRNSEKVTVCSSCEEKWAKCAVCSMPVVGAKPSSQEVLCEVCRQEAKFCAVCGSLIKGQFFKSADERYYYCGKCEATRPHCDGCGDLLRPGDWAAIKGVRLCTSCQADIPRCGTCGVPIVKSGVTFKGFDGIFCVPCTNDKPKCLSCGRPCGEGSMELGGKRHVCADCARTAMLTDEDVQALAKEIRNHLDRNLLMPITHPLAVSLADSLGKTEDQSFKESGRFAAASDKYRITILRGLSRPVGIETLAHELAHAWQAENLPRLRGDLMREGFAQWIAALVLKDYKLNGLVERMAVRDDMYGKGYRELADMEVRLGIEGTFRALRKQGGPRETK